MNRTRSILSTLAALGASLAPIEANPLLGSAARFAVLGASTVTSTGTTILNGDLGLSPGTAITGFGPGIVNGATHAGDTVAAQAQADALAAYAVLSAELPFESLTGQDLGGRTLSPGVRNFLSSAQLTGTLTLDAGGDSNARFDFQIGSTLTTASASSVVLVNGARADNVFWRVGSSATLGTGTSFLGSILADTSITLETLASLSGRALALDGAVTLDSNLVTVPSAIPEPGSFWPSVLGASLLGAWRWSAGSRQRPDRG
jgi:type VI secretion system secreted protein VgrG